MDHVQVCVGDGSQKGNVHHAIGYGVFEMGWKILQKEVAQSAEFFECWNRQHEQSPRRRFFIMRQVIGVSEVTLDFEASIENLHPR